MEESGVIHFDEHLSPIHFLEESSIRLVDDLRDRFEFYANRFNEYRGGVNNAVKIKIFKISNTVNDFMLFRNSLRLIFSRKGNDLITIGILSGNGSLLSPRISVNSQVGGGTLHELKAHIGPFNKVSWTFQGESIDLDALVRHYLSEFIRVSSR